MLNPIIELKNTLFQNCVNSFKEKIMTITAQFPKARISIGYVSSAENAADTVTKVLLDPVPVINSKLFREGPMKYDSLETLKEDTVARVSKDGEFIFLGIPERFLTSDPGTSKCMKCLDNCWMVRTRAQSRKNLEEDNLETKKREKNELDFSPNSTQTFFRRVSCRLVSITQQGHLLNPHEPLRGCLVLDKKTYDYVLAKCFTLPKILQFCSWVAALDLAKKGVSWRAGDIKAECLALLIRTSQTHYKQNLDKLCDVKIHGIRFMSLRLQVCHTMLFNTNFLPVIGSDDPLRIKFIRFHHLVSHAGMRAVHCNKKSTIHAISQGEKAVTWFKKKSDVSRYIDQCGTCNKFKTNVMCQPKMGPSFNRIAPTICPFTHVSIDPLGYVYVKVNASQRTKVYPLIVMDINNGAIIFEILKSLEAKEIFWALCRIEWRLGSQITQIFSDAGSQLTSQILGKRTDFYQQKLSELWGIFNNNAGCQFRNLCERKVQSAKRSVKQALSGKPGVIRETPSLSYLETTLCMVSNTVNRVPYAMAGNTRLLCPLDTLAPWQVRDIPPRKVPGGKNAELVRTQQFLMTIKEQVMSDLLQEFAEETRFATSTLRMGKNKNCRVTPQPGDVVQLWTQNNFEVGVMTRLLRGRHAMVRLSSGRVVETSTANLSLIAMSHVGEVEILETLEERSPRTFTHFVSIDLYPEDNLSHEGCSRSGGLPCISPVQEYQSILEEIRGIGSPVQKSRMHVTMALLTVPEGDMEKVKDAITSAMVEFKDMIARETFFLGISGLEVFSTPCGEKHLVSEVKLGRHSLALMRASIFERLGEYISDKTFRPHATIFRRSQLTEENEARVLTAVHGISLGVYQVSSVTLRQKKKKDTDEPNEPVVCARFSLKEL